MDEVPPVNENGPKQPPPVPPMLTPPETSGGSSFAQKAGTLSVWAPLPAVTLTMSLGMLLPSSGEWARLSKLLSGSTGGLLIIAGFILGSWL